MRILNFESFINEGYEEKPEYQIKAFFDGFEKRIRKYFDTGALSKDDIELVDISQVSVNSMEKTLVFDFQDTEFYYQVIVIVDFVSVSEDGLKDCFVKVKKYDSDSKLVGMYSKDMPITELNEEKLWELFSKIEDSDSEILPEDDDSDNEEENQDIQSQTQTNTDEEEPSLT